jgi:hypothetical protein
MGQHGQQSWQCRKAGHLSSATAKTKNKVSQKFHEIIAKLNFVNHPIYSLYLLEGSFIVVHFNESGVP